MKKIPTVTVAISAFNEEQNIINFLKSVINQKEMGFKLKNILIYSDGSDDKTVTLARSLKNKKIKIFNDRTRFGKSRRLNQIYASIKSDILVQSDADVVFAHPYVIYDIIQPLIKNKKIGMCGGNPVPYPGETWIEKAINVTCDAFREFRNQVREGNNVFSADGRLLAYRTTVVKKINVPDDMIANDAYTYYYNLTLKNKYKFVPLAVVYYRSPKTLKDHIRQNMRFLAAPKRMTKYFDTSLIRKELHIPTTLKIEVFLKYFLKHPVYCLTIYIVNKYCFILANLKENNMNAKWKLAKTTKLLINDIGY